jgi:hypothetical protein
MAEALQIRGGIRQKCLLFLLGLAKSDVKKILVQKFQIWNFTKNLWGESHIISWEQKSFKHQEPWLSEHSLGPKTSLYRSRVKN